MFGTLSKSFATSVRDRASNEIVIAPKTAAISPLGANIFGDRVKNIRKNIIWIAIMGAIYGLVSNAIPSAISPIPTKTRS